MWSMGREERRTASSGRRDPLRPGTTCDDRFLHWRRAGVRDKITERLAAGYLAVVKLDRIRLWLPVDESTT